MGKKKKTKFRDVVCFCPTRPDLDAILHDAITGERWLGEIVDVLSTAYDLEAAVSDQLRVDTRFVHWDSNAPPIELIDEEGKPARFRIDTAQTDLKDLVVANPHAWFSRSPSPVEDLLDRLARSRVVVRIRWPDVETQPVKRAPYWIARALALAIRHATGGVVMFDDAQFLTRSGELLSQRG